MIVGHFNARERENLVSDRGAKSYQFLSDPLGALGQELEVWVGVDREDVYQFGLEQGSDVYPFLVNLLNSGEQEELLFC